MAMFPLVRKTLTALACCLIVPIWGCSSLPTLPVVSQGGSENASTIPAQAIQSFAVVGKLSLIQKQGGAGTLRFFWEEQRDHSHLIFESFIGTRLGEVRRSSPDPSYWLRVENQEQKPFASLESILMALLPSPSNVSQSLPEGFIIDMVLGRHQAKWHDYFSRNHQDWSWSIDYAQNAQYPHLPQRIRIDSPDYAFRFFIEHWSAVKDE